MMERIHLRPVFIVVIEFSVVWIKLPSNKLFSNKTLDWVSSPVFPKSSPYHAAHLAPRLGSPALVHTACGLGQRHPPTYTLGWVSRLTLSLHLASLPSGTQRATKASNVKGPVYSSNLERKSVNKKRNRSMHSNP